MKNIVEYNEILNNCGHRISFDTNMLRLQLKRHANWKDIILKRHHEFVLAYLECNYDLAKVKKITQYGIKDLESILLRVQSQFEIYEENNASVFKDMYINVYGANIFSNNIKEKKVEQIDSSDIIFNEEDDQMMAFKTKEQDKIKERDKVKQVIKNTIKSYNDFMVKNYNAIRAKKIDNMINSLSKLDNPEVLKDIFPYEMYRRIDLLIKGSSIDMIVKQYKLNKSYLLLSLVGSKNPKCNYDKGIIRFLEEYLKKNYD